MPSKIKNPYLKETPGLKKFVENSKPLVTRGYGGQENVHRGEGQRVHKPGTAGTGARTTMTSGVGYEAKTDMRSESRGSRAFREWETKYNATGKALQKDKVGQFQTKSKQTLLTQQKKGEVPKTKGDWKTVLRNQTSTSKGGGKSGGGGGGKWGGMFKGRGGSPWNLLRNDKNF
jgi:hypothetical protein